MVNVQLPDSASMERTERRHDDSCRIATRHIRASSIASGISGQSFVLNAFGSNFGSMFVNLQGLLPSDAIPSLSSDAIANYLRTEFAQADSRGATCRSFRRRRFAASAGPAVS